MVIRNLYRRWLTKVNEPAMMLHLAGLMVIFAFLYPITATGVLDPSFGKGGKVSFRFTNSSDDFGKAALLQPDGKIVIVGKSGLYGKGSGFDNFGVARVNPNGTLDSTFGTIGLVVTDFNNHNDGANDVAIQADGKIVVGGYSLVGGGSDASRFAVARYNSDGSLDKTFDGDGKVVTDFPAGGSAGISRILLQPDGKIIAVGTYFLPVQIAVVRYNADGTLDSSFGAGGKLTILFSRSTDFNGAAMQPDGKLLITGDHVFPIVGCVPTKENSCHLIQSFLLRYTPEMTLDRKFGRKSGIEFARPGYPNNETFQGIALQANGSIVVRTERSVKRYSANGRLEKIFDLPGFIETFSSETTVVERPDGKIALCGPNAYGDIGVALFNSNGGLIGTDERDFFSGNDVPSAILAQPDNKIVVAGTAQIAQQAAYGFAVVRYLDIVP